tara:strand:+ start:160 stop:1995 length:1836 start_codon:yes stop_codon:yes gene_type:complete
MPFVRYNFNPGINKEGTAYSNEGGWYDANFVRFRSGRPEKIGGWEKRNSNTFLGTSRKLHQWAALDSDLFVSIGTHKKLYVLQGSSYYDITPLRSTTSAGDVTFAKVANDDATINVTDSSHGAVKGDYVTFSAAASLGGNITAAVLNQEYEITSITSANVYTIEAKDTDGDEVLANSSDSGNGGSSVVGKYQINIGLDSYVDGIGWSSGYWGESSWGGGTAGFSSQLRLWSLDNFGEDLIACPRLGEICYWDKSSGTSTRSVPISSLSGASGTPAEALQVLVSEKDRHVIALGCTPYGGSSIDYMQIRWSDQADAADWTPKTTNSAGDTRLSSGSKIICGIKTRQEIIIWTDTSIYSMRFVGPPFIFGFDMVTQGVSIASPNAAINANNAIYFMDKDNFYIYNGSIQSLPCTVRAYVFEDINDRQEFKIFAARNAQFNEIMWFYCSSSSDEIDRYVIYNYLENNWSIGQLSRTAWDDAGTSSVTPLATSSSYIYNHEVGYDDDGSAMSAYVESADFDIDDGNNFAFVRRIIPDILFTGSAGSPTVTYTLKTRSSGSGTLVSASTASVGSTTQMSNVRARGRQIRVRIENSDSANGWRLGDVRLDVRQDGRR